MIFARTPLLLLLFASLSAMPSAHAWDETDLNFFEEAEYSFAPTPDDPRYPHGYPMGQSIESRKTGDKIQMRCLELGNETCTTFQFLLTPKSAPGAPVWLAKPVRFSKEFEQLSVDDKNFYLKRTVRKLLKSDAQMSHALGLLTSAVGLGVWLKIILDQQDRVGWKVTESRFGLWVFALGGWLAWTVTSGRGSQAFDLYNAIRLGSGYPKNVIASQQISGSGSENFSIRSVKISNRKFERFKHGLNSVYWRTERKDGRGPVVLTDQFLW